MRKFVVTLMTSLLGCSAAFAFFPEAVDSSLELGVGYRCDRINWKTSARTFISDSNYADENEEGCSPIVNHARFKSDLNWRHLNIWQVEARGKYVTCDNIYLRGYADYGWITNGRVHDRDHLRFDDYCDDNNGRDFSYGYNDHSRRRGRSRHGHVYDVSLAAGYQFKLCDDSLSLDPLIGYSWQGQHLQFRRGHRCHSDYSNNCNDYTRNDDCYDRSSGSGHRNRGRYRTRWNGPFIGLDADYRFCCDWTVFASYEFHWARYRASGRFNLRRDFVGSECHGHFRHHSRNAHGQIASVGVKWDMCDCWTLGLRGDFQWWRTRHGRDKVKTFEHSRGSVEEECFFSIPLKHVSWRSAAITVDVGMVF